MVEYLKTTALPLPCLAAVEASGRCAVIMFVATIVIVLLAVGIGVVAVQEIRRERKVIAAWEASRPPSEALPLNSGNDLRLSPARRLGCYTLLIYPFCGFAIFGIAMGIGDSGAWTNLPRHSSALFNVAFAGMSITTLLLYTTPVFAIGFLITGEAHRRLALLVTGALGFPLVFALHALAVSGLAVAGTTHHSKEMIISAALEMGGLAAVILIPVVLLFRFVLKHWPPVSKTAV